MKAKIISLIAVALLLIGTALAASNPSGTGQPNQNCETAGVMPNGFTTGGFANAATVYAGSPGSASALNSNSVHAVSQYDVACYQLASKLI